MTQQLRQHSHPATPPALANPTKPHLNSSSFLSALFFASDSQEGIVLPTPTLYTCVCGCVLGGVWVEGLRWWGVGWGDARERGCHSWRPPPHQQVLLLVLLPPCDTPNPALLSIICATNTVSVWLSVSP